jgi:hypothetical protein
LFEYTLKAWNNQKGDHCTYKYIPSRESHLEMCATVLVRLPDKPSLMVKDSKFRQSRVLAQNAVAQLALQKLAQDDPELREKLDQMAKEVEERKTAVLNGEVPPPPPPPSRYISYPAEGLPSEYQQYFHWSSGGRRSIHRQQYYYNQPAHPAYPYYPGPMGSPMMGPHPTAYASMYHQGPNRSNSAPEIQTSMEDSSNRFDENKYYMQPPQQPMPPEYMYGGIPADMYYQQGGMMPPPPPLDDAVSHDTTSSGTTPSSGLMTPTVTSGAPSWVPAFPPSAPAAYYPYGGMDMFYPMMMGPPSSYMPPQMAHSTEQSEPTSSSQTTSSPPLCH